MALCSSRLPPSCAQITEVREHCQYKNDAKCIIFNIIDAHVQYAYVLRVWAVCWLMWVAYEQKEPAGHRRNRRANGGEGETKPAKPTLAVQSLIRTRDAGKACRTTGLPISGRAGRSLPASPIACCFLLLQSSVRSGLCYGLRRPCGTRE